MAEAKTKRRRKVTEKNYDELITKKQSELQKYEADIINLRAKIKETKAEI